MFAGEHVNGSEGRAVLHALLRCPRGESPPGLAWALAQVHETLDAMLAYAGYALNVVGRSVACNSYHSIVERLARWLLTMHDRVEREELSLTHDMLSQMLTATRPRVRPTARAPGPGTAPSRV